MRTSSKPLLRTRIGSSQHYQLFLLIVLVVAVMTRPVAEHLNVNMHFVSFLNCLDIVSFPDTIRVENPCRMTVLSQQFEPETRNAALLRLEGHRALYGKQPQIAVGHYRQALALDKNPVVYWGLGNAYEAIGQYEAAISAMNAAGNLDYVPSVLDSNSIARLREFALAAIALEIHAAEAYLFLGKGAVQDDPEEAIVAFEEAARLASDPATRAEAHTLLGELLYAQDAGEAEHNFRQAIAAEPDDIFRYYEIVRFYQDQARDIDMALRWAHLMAEAFPRASLTHDALGWLGWLQGDADEALSHYQQATLAPDDTIQPWTFGRYGNISMELSQYNEAQQSFLNAVVLAGNRSLPLSRRLIAAYLAQENCVAAWSTLDQFIENAAILSEAEQQSLVVTNNDILAVCSRK